MIGDFASLVNGWGAAGFEIEPAGAAWGTPQQTLVLATADGFEGYEITPASLIGGAAQLPPIRADMVLLYYPNGGAVFRHWVDLLVCVPVVQRLRQHGLARDP